MKQHLNTLFITTQGSYLRKEGENVVVSVARQERARMPIHTLGSIVCFGQVTCSPFLMGFCGQRGVSLAFLTERGRFLARVEGPTSGNVLLRREQYRRADCPNMAAELARAFVIGKVANSRTTLQRAARDHADKSGHDAFQPAINALGRVLRELSVPLSLDVVRGKEGEAARTYFGAFDHQITAQKDTFSFSRRTRRPPEDNVNALLSFLYTLLLQDVRSACEAAGLDPQVGFLHRDRPGRPGLALDLMEEFRAMLADRLAVSLINRRQAAPKGFKQTESGGVHMDDETRKTVLIAYQKRKMEPIVHPFLNEKMTVGLLPHVQARLLSRHLRGDLDAYPPLLWK
jgi:CRISPR-associated protein Cas1